jgi:hypothetical protein
MSQSKNTLEFQGYFCLYSEDWCRRFEVEDLKSIFDQLKTMLAVYKPPMNPKLDSDRAYDLWTIKDVDILGKKRTEVYFAGIVIRKTNVGFYYMPIYAEPELKRFLKPELLARLKGKSCFHINKLTPELKVQIADALKAGYRQYQERGWV